MANSLSPSLSLVRLPAFFILQVSFLKVISSLTGKVHINEIWTVAKNILAVCVANQCITGRLVDSRQGSDSFDHLDR